VPKKKAPHHKRHTPHHHRAAGALVLCLLLVLVVHVAWRAGYRAAKGHEIPKLALLTDDATLLADLSRWWTWLLPAMLAIFAGAFRDLITDQVRTRLEWAWHRLRRAFA
jgi:hypothetical protein